jgi:hypothetical protein
MAVTGAQLIRVVDPQQRAAIIKEFTNVTRSPGGIDRVRLDPARLNFDPVNPDLETAIARYADVLGPRYAPLESTPLQPRGTLDLREGIGAPGDGISWTVRFLSGDTGEPIVDGTVGAWMVAPKGFRGIADAAYYPDAFRAQTQIGPDGTVKIVAHDPIPYEYPAGSGNILEPHIHGYHKGIPGHVEGAWEQLRINMGVDLDDVTYDIVVPAGSGRAVLGPWDAHPAARIGAPGTPDAGFILRSEPAPLS